MIGLATFAAVVRAAYALALIEPAGTDELEVARFRAFLAGQGPPAPVTR